jgi:hypothetical protein
MTQNVGIPPEGATLYSEFEQLKGNTLRNCNEIGLYIIIRVYVLSTDFC